MPHLHDTIIAGAGPVGLFLACELRLAGLSVLVLEKAETPDSPLKRLPFGMRGLSAPTLEALDRRDLLEAVIAAQPPADRGAHWQQQARRPAGHFAGIQFFHDQIDESAWPWRLSSPVGTSLAVTLDSIETVLAARAEAMGVEIRRGCSVEGLAQADDAVTVQAGGERFRARWLVGCDGGRSVVRKAAGFDFAGTEPEFTGYSVEVTLADPDALPAGRHYTPAGMFTFARPGTIAMVDFDGGAFHRSQPITREHVETVLRRVSGVPVTLTALHLATSWTDRAFQATAYRRGRVLLAGDATHIHSPLGGQGLNLGIGDAMNLGWKLAATIRGDAPAGLLDSYEAERMPVGAQILDWSRAQVTLMRPTPGTRALEGVVRALMATDDGATWFAGRISGVTQRYDLGGGHELIGRSMPDFALTDGRRAGELLRGGKGLLLDFEGSAALRAVAERWAGRIDYVARDAVEQLGVGAVLVRPDGVVAWVDSRVPGARGMTSIAAQWFGEPGS